MLLVILHRISLNLIQHPIPILSTYTTKYVTGLCMIAITISKEASRLVNILQKESRELPNLGNLMRK